MNILMKIIFLIKGRLSFFLIIDLIFDNIFMGVKNVLEEVEHIILLNEDFNKIIELIECRKNNAFVKINEELILMYLDIGKFLYNLQQNSKYGDKITTKAAQFMKNNHPNVKGFTKKNIERMIQFYKTYKDDTIATPLVTQLSWTNNLLILSGTNTIEERHFYLQLAVKNKYSKRELDRQISSLYYERYLLSDGKQLPTVTKKDGEEYSLSRNISQTLISEYKLKLIDKKILENKLKEVKSLIK